MKTIEITDADYALLTALGKDYYVIKGEEAMKPEEVLRRIINDERSKVYPRRYQTSGFDRQ